MSVDLLCWKGGNDWTAVAACRRGGKKESRLVSTWGSRATLPSLVLPESPARIGPVHSLHPVLTLRLSSPSWLCFVPDCFPCWVATVRRTGHALSYTRRCCLSRSVSQMEQSEERHRPPFLLTIHLSWQCRHTPFAKGWNQRVIHWNTVPVGGWLEADRNRTERAVRHPLPGNGRQGKTPTHLSVPHCAAREAHWSSRGWNADIMQVETHLELLIGPGSSQVPLSSFAFLVAALESST